MMAEPSRVRLTLASKADAERGLFGFVAFRLGEFEIDGVTLRRTRAGELTLSYPARRDRSGRDHPYFRPIGDRARRRIESQVFEALGLGEVRP